MAAKAHARLQDIVAKPQFGYLETYLREIYAKTLVVENEYIDRDYLSDFASYYVRCFTPYNRHCTRIHLFSIAFDEEEFKSLLRRSSADLSEARLNEHYLGFIVVKPLPKTVIGRTCLRTYEHDSRRFFPSVHDYSVNLFGMSLSVESLAFQEQDSVAAACATSALWSAFHGTSRLFQHHIPTPFEITASATAHSPSDTRTFPNAGLSFVQIAEAIRNVGLEPYLIGASEEFTLKGSLYAYLKGMIPVIMGMSLIDRADINPRTNEPWVMGLHAITIAGYSLARQGPKPFGTTGFLLRATRIDKIYAHDDQIGPFAKMTSMGGVILDTSWTRPITGSQLTARAIGLQVPVYHKIRIPFESVLYATIAFDRLIELIRISTGNLLQIAERLEWDVYLTTSNNFRHELLSKSSVSGNYLERVLTERLPRYVWRATALSGEIPFLDLLFDTTDIVQGVQFVTAVEHLPGTNLILQQIAASIRQVPGFESREDREILNWFASYVE